MATRFEAASLVASPSYPNAVVWSEENFVAVASGHLVTILKPATPFGPRGLITIPGNKPFPMGVIERKDLLSGCLLTTCLSRDVRPCVRSISWSPVGLASNAGCLLAVCTIEGRVMLYRMPFSEYSAEWVEVIDISEMLYVYLSSVGFGESNTTIDLPNVRQTRFNNMTGSHMHQIGPISKSKAKSQKELPKSCNLPLLTASQYASRSAMLSSLVVSWSPVLPLTFELGLAFHNNSLNRCAILAVGAKAGKISFWRVHGPQYYSVISCDAPTSAILIGSLEAHNSWITAMSWELVASDASNSQLLLATGSSDGSVRIWQGYCRELLETSEVIHAPFSLLKEVIVVDRIPVSILSLILPVKSLPKMLLAIGKGSGAFEVWSCDVSTCKYDKAGACDAHNHVITGLAWAFDGGCLYSCSEDNTVHCWILHEDTLCEVPIPSNTPDVKCSTNIPSVFDSCFGLAMSPGNLVLAVARSLDADLLNPMYEARSHKAAVEFIWVGGQQLCISPTRAPDFDVEAFLGFPLQELVSWEYNLLWSLNQFERLEKTLVIWDIVAALLAFKQSAAKYVDHVLLKWIRSSTGSQCGVSPAILSHAPKILSNFTSRQLHLMNIILRRVVLAEWNVDEINSKKLDFNRLGSGEELDLYLELLLSSERELRERLVGLYFAAVLTVMKRSSINSGQFGHWHPVGLAQMEHWVSLNRDCVKDQLKLLAFEFGTLEKSRLQSICEYVEDQCGYCSAPVPFESPEVAFCRGVKCDESDGGAIRSHKVARCAVSGKVCPTRPAWFCKCCQRWASELAPRTLFIMSRYPLDFKSLIKSPVPEEPLEPFCPFCGILLQRLLPEFLLSPSPV